MSANPEFEEWLSGKPAQPTPRPAPAAPAAFTGNADNYARKAINEECATLSTTTEGSRNHQLNVAAFKLASIVDAGRADREATITQLADAARRCGLTESEIMPTINSAFRGSANKVGARVIPPREQIPPAYVLDETDESGQPTDAAKDALDDAIRNRALQIRIDRAAKELVDAEQRPKVEYPPVRSLTALLAEPCPPTRWRIDGVLPIDARAILSAQFKAGKTTLTGNLVRSLTDLEPFLGKFAVHSAAAALVLIDDELSEHMVQDWLGRQNVRNTDRVADVITLRGKVSTFNLFDDACRSAWAKRFRDIGADYLILDCLRPILDAFGLDENRDAGLFLVQFDAMLEGAGIRDALLVHHMGHQGERSRGDSRLLDWPDANWRLVRETEEPDSARYFSAYGRDVSVPEGRLTFNEATRHLTYVDGSRGDAKTEAALQAVLTVLVADAGAGGEGMSGRAIEIAVSEDHTQKSIRAAVKLAHQRQLLVKTPGLKNATLHRIAQPCSVCGHPLTAGQGTRHASCVAEVAA